MEKQEKLLKEREQLKEEYNKWNNKYMDAFNKLNALLPNLSVSSLGVEIAKITLTTEYSSEYKNVEKEKIEADAKRREIWDKILEINAKLQS